MLRNRRVLLIPSGADPVLVAQMAADSGLRAAAPAMFAALHAVHEIARKAALAGEPGARKSFLTLTEAMDEARKRLMKHSGMAAPRQCKPAAFAAAIMLILLTFIIQEVATRTTVSVNRMPELSAQGSLHQKFLFVPICRT